MKRYAGLDLLKIYLMCSIAFCFHYRNLLLNSTLPYPFYAILHYSYDYAGWFVIIFFSISGFLAQLKSNTISKETHFNFIKRKIENLYPAMWISVLICAAGQLCTLHKRGGGNYRRIV